MSGSGLGRIVLLALLLAPLAPAAELNRLLVVRRGWHIDVGFPVATLSTPLASTVSSFPSARYAFYGFGDRRYLTAKTHGVATLAKAIWPGEGVMLLTTISNEPDQAFGARNLVELQLSAKRMAGLQLYLWSSFVSRAAHPVLIQQGPYAGSQYFESTYRYSGLHTCNTWVAEVLNAGDFHIRRRGMLLAGQLWPKVRGLGTAPSVADPKSD